MVYWCSVITLYLNVIFRRGSRPLLKMYQQQDCVLESQELKHRPILPLGLVCSKSGCGKIAHFQPVLLVWAKVDWKKSRKQCLRMEIVLSLCDPCSKTIKASDLISDEGWEQIRQAIMSLGKAEPDRNSAIVELKPLCGNN